MKNIILLLVLCVFSCKQPKANKNVQHDKFVANVDTINNKLIYSYKKKNKYGIKIENLKTNKLIFSFKISDWCFTVPRLHKNKICFPKSNDTFVCMDYKRNVKLWEIKTNGRVIDFQFVNDSIIIASIKSYGIIAINSNSGKIIYELLLKSDKNCIVDFSPRSIFFDNNNFYVTDFNCNSIVAYNISSGKKVWYLKESEFYSSNLVVAGKYIFIGSNYSYKTGMIRLIDIKTGKLAYQHNSKFEIMGDLYHYKGKIYYYTYDKKLNEFDINNKTNKVIYRFEKNDGLFFANFYLLDNFIYFQDSSFNLNKVNIATCKKEFIEKSPKGLLGVYKNNNLVKFVY